MNMTSMRELKLCAGAWAIVSALLLFPSTPLACAELRLPTVLGDHMVFQRDAPVPVWGQMDPGEAVAVLFADQVKRTTADADGRWRVDLDAMPANASPGVLRVESGGQSLRREDILVGEVWLCAGQSNMQMGLARAADGEAEVAGADDPLLRLMRVENHVVPRGGDVVGEWAACAPASAERFSAAGYYFGLELRRELGVPVGLIVSAWGATGGESWLPIEAIRDLSDFAPVIERDRQREVDRPKLQAEHEAALARWRAERDAAEIAGKPLPPTPRLPMSLRPQSRAGSLYDSMVLPLAPFAMRGSIWYQGEGNVGQGERYHTLLTLLIDSWRRAWGQENFFFGIVQLPNYRPIVQEPGDSHWARLRDAQCLTAERVPDTGLAVTIDLGEADEGHPKNKRGVGERLARWALAEVYGLPIAGHGPVFLNVTFEDGDAIVTFEDGPGELQSTDGQPIGSFAIAGADRRWCWARVEIIGTRTVRVWSEEISSPVAVRYAWSDNPALPNLTDGSAIPASPFRTDDWPAQ